MLIGHRTWTKFFYAGVLLLVVLLSAAFAQDATWESNYDAAKQAFTEHRSTDAEKSYLAALVQAENLEPKDPRLATTLMGLGIVYYVQRRYEEVEPLLERTVELREEEAAADPSDLAKAQLQLAELYRATRHFAKAEALYRRTLASAGPPNADPVTTATVHLDLGLLYSAQDRLEEAKTEYTSAVSGFQNSVGTARTGLGFSNLNLAQIYESETRFTDAESRYQQALAAFAEASGPNSPNVATTLDNYARLLRKMNRKNEAAKMKKRAEEIRRHSPSF
jgi:tetratricopeptide (TPR) repeat protein